MTPPQKPQKVYDEWERLPVRPGQRLCGLSRSTLLELVFSGKLKSCVLRKTKESKRTIRLIHMPSLFAYLEAQVERH
jgi:hypothetical protein